MVAKSLTYQSSTGAAVEDMFFLRQVTEGTPSLEYNGFNTKHARESGQ